MKFITLRNATDYYSYNGMIYACYMDNEWYLESTNSEDWIRRTTAHQKPLTPEEIKKWNEDNERRLYESYERLSCNEIKKNEKLPELKPLGKPSIWLRIKRNLIPKKHRTYGMYPEHVLVYR